MKDFLLFVLRYVVIGLAIGFLYIFFFHNYNNQTVDTHTPQPVFTYAPAIDKINPSVVSIYTQSIERSNGPSQGISPAAPYTTRNYLGSGVVVSADGHIVTNKHVIAGATRVFVYLWDNQAYQARFVGEDSLTDLAVIKIEASDLVAAEFADSELLNTGDVVLAIGNPFGLNQSASMGIVSATGRRGLTETTSQLQQLENFIQTDAAINQGNSGGALINPSGQVVGISTASYSQYGAEGINFAIPSNTTVQIINAIIKHGKVLRGWLGIFFIPASSHVIYKIPKPSDGIMVSQVQINGPADQAGIKTYDVITHLNGKPISSFDDYTQLLLSYTIGEVVEISGYNADGTFNKSMTIKLPPDPGKPTSAHFNN